jgi:hypothetical protein
MISVVRLRSISAESPRTAFGPGALLIRGDDLQPFLPPLPCLHAQGLQFQ